MKTLFAVWGLGALALAGTICFAPNPVRETALPTSPAVAAAEAAGQQTSPATKLPGRALPAPSLTAQAALAPPPAPPAGADKRKLQKPNAWKLAQKKSKKSRATSHKRKKKGSSLVSFRKFDRFLKRVF